MSDERQEVFTQWALVELFGHSRIAGLVTEQSIGGCSFLRVDVPAIDTEPAFTKCYGNGAIYAMTFVAEEVARAAAKAYRVVPVSVYEIPELRQLRLPAVAHDQDDEPDDEKVPF
jgi:hypothetical protein